MKRATALIDEKQTGQDVYYNPEFKTFTSITSHYERLGSLLKIGYLEFEIFFEIIPFPEQFWHDSAPLRQVISKNWGGRDEPLPDFLENFQWLCQAYKDARNESRPGAGNSLRCE